MEAGETLQGGGYKRPNGSVHRAMRAMGQPVPGNHFFHVSFTSVP